MSQEQLGEKLGVSRQAVSKWENSEALPEIDKIVLLASVFGVTTDELLSGNIPEEDESGVNGQHEANDAQWQSPLTDVDGFETGPFAPVFRLAKRKGYIAGYYFMGIGALMGIMVLVFLIASSSMFGDFPVEFANDSFDLPRKIFAGLGFVIAAAVFTIGVVVLVKQKKYRR